ncbi:MAG: class I SAM-dependent methyltransferase [Deltaproteobacteria bacterium]|nr:class I SAM-dependent methyltransferase [Deltaproteobacteria bacterium]
MKSKDIKMGYKLLDSGKESKLERVGPYLLVRPSPQAVWSPGLPEKEWQGADAVYIRSSTGGGNWEFKRRLPERWEIEYRGLKFFIKPTGFGHLGVFPEHGESWDWIEERIREAKGPINLLNMFAYTGGATMAALRAGAAVCHLDASKGVVDWARENAVLSGLSDRPVRWIVDDVVKFVQKEIRRGKRYDAIMLDPPSFGRGASGEIWKIEDDLLKFLLDCRKLLSEKPLFIHLSCHSPGFTPLVLQNLLAEMMQGRRGSLSNGEMVISEISGRLLPSGAHARWTT